MPRKRITFIVIPPNDGQMQEYKFSSRLLWLGIGADPLHPVCEIPKMTKPRYDIMRAYLPTRGKLGLDMMHATATMQANYDYADEADMAAKMRMAMGVAPLCSALFANSCWVSVPFSLASFSMDVRVYR